MWNNFEDAVDEKINESGRTNACIEYVHYSVRLIYGAAWRIPGISLASREATLRPVRVAAAAQFIRNGIEDVWRRETVRAPNPKPGIN